LIETFLHLKPSRNELVGCTASAQLTLDVARFWQLVVSTGPFGVFAKLGFCLDLVQKSHATPKWDQEYSIKRQAVAGL
jgi:hypothetical protein